MPTWELKDGTVVHTEVGEDGQEYEVSREAPADIRTTPLNVSEERLSPWQSFQVGRHRGNVGEIEAELGGRVLDTGLTGLYWYPPDGSDPRQINPTGPDWGDIPRVIGEEIGPTVGSAAAAIGSKSLPGLIVRSILGGFAGSMGNEAAQYAEGTQQETLGQQAGRAAVDAAIEGGAGAAGGILARTVPGGGIAPGSNWSADQLERAMRFQEGRPDLYPSPLPGDILSKTGVGPGGLVPGQVMSQMEKQAAGGSDILPNLREDMTSQAAKGAESEFRLPPQSVERASDRLADAAYAERERLRDAVASRGPTAEAGQYQLNQGLRQGERTAAGKVSAQYEGPLAKAVEEEAPVFDISRFHKEWDRPTFTQTQLRETGLLDEYGFPWVEKVKEQVAGLPDVPSKVQYVRKFLASMDPEQTNFEALKRVRTMVGEHLREDPIYRQASKQPMERLYGELSEVLGNPVNKTQTPKYLQEFENANLITRWKSGLVDADSVRKVLKARGGGSLLVTEIGNDPSRLVTPEFRELFDLAPESTRKNFRASVQRAILSGEDPASVVKKLQDSTNPESYKYLFDSDEQRLAFEQSSRRISSWFNGPMGQIYRQAEEELAPVRIALEKIETPRQAKAFYDRLPALQQSDVRELLIDDLVGKASGFNSKSGLPTINTKTLDTRIAELKRNGTWNFLTPDQRRRIEDMPAYFRTVINKFGDVGSNLENASIVADLKDALSAWYNPKALLRAVGAAEKFAHNELLARYLSNPNRVNKLRARLKKEPRDIGKWGAASIIALPVLSNSAKEGVIDPAWDYLKGETEETP